MELIKVDKKVLDNFTYLMAISLNTDYNGLRGFDTDNKVMTVYMAQEILGYNLDLLCEFYRIDKDQLKLGFHGISVALLIDKTLKNRINDLKIKWLNLLDNE
tara:strand:+ start:2485 stop:2790 length:306 start_codon:yes stop_codon:yes gene_type:complete